MTSFEDFWNLYDKKVDRKKCIQKWRRIKESDRELIMSHLPEYIESTPDKQYRKNPQTYLNGECWHDEVIHYQRAKEIKVNDHETIFEKFKKKHGIIVG